MSFNIGGLDNKIDRTGPLDKFKFHIENVLKYSTKMRIQESDFEDVFGPEIVKEDLKLVARVKERFEQQKDNFSLIEKENVNHGEKIGEALEIIIAEDGERYHWFGADSLLSRSSNYDDLINGADVMVEILQKSENNESHTRPKRIALAIDASSNLDAIPDKIKRNEDKLVNKYGKNIPEMKYHQSAFNPNLKGSLEVIIPVVIGLESKYVHELMSASSVVRSADDASKRSPAIKDTIEENKRKNNKKLELHPAQIIFCQQILTQLNHYLKILKYRHDETGKNYQSEIEMLLEEFKKIMSEKEKLETFNENWQGEAVLQKIKSYTDNTNIDYSIYASGNVYDAPRKTIIYKRKKKKE